jgi:hypothetical protein
MAGAQFGNRLVDQIADRSAKTASGELGRHVSSPYVLCDLPGKTLLDSQRNLNSMVIAGVREFQGA